MRPFGAHIPGIARPATTDLPVLLPIDRAKASGPDAMMVSRWLANLPPWTPLAIAAVILISPTTTLGAGEVLNLLGIW